MNVYEYLLNYLKERERLGEMQTKFDWNFIEISPKRFLDETEAMRLIVDALADVNFHSSCLACEENQPLVNKALEQAAKVLGWGKK